MTDPQTPAQRKPPVLGGVEIERAPELAPITFVGGTGRSGTHVLAQVLSRNRRIALIPLEVLVDGEPVAELPPSLEGMYLSGAGRGAFWPAGEFDGSGSATVTVRATEPSGLQEALGVERRVWLGDLAASPVADPRPVPIEDACGDYVDHFTLERNR